MIILNKLLYYSYFKDHLVELATLTRETSYFIQRTDILDYHKAHTAGYPGKEKRLLYILKWVIGINLYQGLFTADSQVVGLHTLG